MTTSTSVMAVLKDRSWDLHERAESHPFEKAMVTGRLPLAGFVEFLAQMWSMHERFDPMLSELAQSHAAFRAVVRPHQFQAGYLEEDLAWFGRDITRVTALPCVQAEVDAMDAARRREPLHLLGRHYVLEGSKNGAAYVARAAQRAYGLSQGGLKYLAPYGAAQREHWAAFKTDMDSIAFSATEIEQLVGGARAMFEGMIRVSDELWCMVEKMNAAAANEPAPGGVLV